MRILVVGSGGREHALVWKLKQSPLVREIYAAPGNGGSAIEGAIITPIKADALDELAAFAVREDIDLVVPGPELPLTLGIADVMRKAGIPCFGPDAHCARLEGSKSFAKEIMLRAGVPTAAHRVFDDAEAAKAHIRALDGPVVVKADGLAAGKGVIVADAADAALAAVDEIMGRRAFGDAGASVVVEERLVGEEVSFLCLCAGETAVPLSSAQDHKAAFDGDQGPNTGGMGACSPAPLLPDSGAEAMADLVIRPILRELAKEGHPFTGVLYAGLMMTADGPRVLEYNVRFGDPECQPILMRLDGDLAAILRDAAAGSLDPAAVRWKPSAALGVVIAARGYPQSCPRGMRIDGLDEAEADGARVFHSGTRLERNLCFSDGGRVLCVTALGDDLAAAKEKAYAAVGRIRMQNMQYRKDIGDKAIRHLAAAGGGK